MAGTREVTLDEHVTVRAAADGTAVAVLGPQARQLWKISNLAVQCASSAPEPAAPTAKLYTGPVTAGSYLAGTYDGVNDNASVNVTVARGGLVTCVWEDADPGATCTLSVYGSMKVPA